MTKLSPRSTKHKVHCPTPTIPYHLHARCGDVWTRAVEIWKGFGTIKLFLPDGGLSIIVCFQTSIMHSSVCTVCTQALCNAHLLPCLHDTMCSTCAEDIYEHQTDCPTCGRVVTGYLVDDDREVVSQVLIVGPTQSDDSGQSDISVIDAWFYFLLFVCFALWCVCLYFYNRIQ
jgi:hypothetical protein